MQNLDSLPDKHPQFDKLAKVENPTADLEIPKKLFLSWCTLRRKQDELAIPASSFMELLQNSLAVEANVRFSIHSPSSKLEKPLSKECLKTVKKIQGLQWDPKKKLEESSMLMMIYTEEGNLELVTNTTDKHDENLVPKLHISIKLYS